MTRHIAHVNRTVLFIIGLILLAGGGAALVRGLGTYPTILGRCSSPIVTAAQTRYPGQHAWVWPAAAAIAAIIALLALLLALSSRPAPAPCAACPSNPSAPTA